MVEDSSMDYLFSPQLWDTPQKIENHSLFFFFSTIGCTLLTLIAITACDISTPLYFRSSISSSTYVIVQQILTLLIITISAIAFSHIEGFFVPHKRFDLSKYNILILVIISFTCENIYFATQYNQLKNDKKVLHTNSKALEAEAERLKANEEISRLSRQVDNHFMMNNLAILDLLIDTNDNRASDFCKSMIGFYRRLISFQGKQFISLEEEFRFTSDFISMMQIRYPESIFFDIDVNSMESIIPPLALQGLVGNALKHNYFSIENPLKISVTEKDGLLIIENNRYPIVSKQPATHMGLTLLKEQYKALNKEVAINSDTESFSVVLPILHSLS